MHLKYVSLRGVSGVFATLPPPFKNSLSHTSGILFPDRDAIFSHKCSKKYSFTWVTGQNTPHHAPRSASCTYQWHHVGSKEGKFQFSFATESLNDNRRYFVWHHSWQFFIRQLAGKVIREAKQRVTWLRSKKISSSKTRFNEISF